MFHSEFLSVALVFLLSHHLGRPWTVHGSEAWQRGGDDHLPEGGPAGPELQPSGREEPQAQQVRFRALVSAPVGCGRDLDVRAGLHSCWAVWHSLGSLGSAGEVLSQPRGGAQRVGTVLPGWGQAPVSL